MNCRGLSGQKKRRDVLNYFKKSAFDVIFLQDTHISTNSLSYFDMLWPGKCYHAIKTSNSRGTSILFKCNLQYDVVSEIYGEDGNYVAIVCTIDTNIYTFFSIYGPNEDMAFFLQKN